MRILIKGLLFVLLAAPLFAADPGEIPLSGVIMESAVDPYPTIYEIMNIEDAQWFRPGESERVPQDKDLVLRVQLDPVKMDTIYYLTEHRGVQSWEYFLVRDEHLLTQKVIDLDQPFWDENYTAAQYRGFSYIRLGLYPGEAYTLYIHLEQEYQSNYEFVLRSTENFTRRQQMWSLIQGMGIGYLFVVFLLSFVLVVRMRYLINWLFLVLVFFSGVGILFITGLGSFYMSGIFPNFPDILWYLFLGLNIPVTIMYISNFLKLSKKSDRVLIYFRILFYLSCILAFSVFAVPAKLVFLYVNQVSLAFYFLVLIGLLWFAFHKLNTATWLLPGWLLSILTPVVGYTYMKANPGSIASSTVSYILGQGFLIMFFGGAMIMEIDRKRRDESVLRENAEKAVQSAMSRMSETERMADLGSLVASVTHELGTPLGISVTLSTNMLSTSKNIQRLFESNALSEEDFAEYVKDVKDSAGMIFRNMETARTLIDGFKEVASDQAMPDIREINLKTYCNTIIDVLAPSMKKKQLSIELEMSDMLVLVSIPGILSQVMTNLINNAVIHGLEGTENGCILISGEQKEKEVILKVSDNGKGMSSETMDQIFEMYFTTKKGHGGTGVGLSIVRSLVEDQLKGSISVESKEGEGATFIVRLPHRLS